MKELSIEEKAKAYDEAIEQAEKELTVCRDMNCDAARQIFRLFPQLAESEDERIRRRLIQYFSDFRLGTFAGIEPKKIIDWLEKQGTPAKLSEEEQNRFAKGVLSSCALSFIDYLDAHKYEGKMCVSNGECEDIENAFHNAMWDKLHRYYGKYIEKQGEQNPANSAKTCKDEQKPYGKREECYDCQMNYGGTCKGSCAMKRGEQKYVEWSEEDKDMLRMLLEMINYASDHYQHDDKATDIKAWVLKSLKDRCTWKPSEEMLEALDIAIRAGIQLGSWEEKALRELQKQLKAL